MTEPSTTQRDDLAETLNEAVEVFYEPFDGHESTRIAARILAAGYRKPRTITTVEELDALPEGSAVLDGVVCVKRADRYWKFSDLAGVYAGTGITLPATVLHEPEAEATR